MIKTIKSDQNWREAPKFLHIWSLTLAEMFINSGKRTTERMETSDLFVLPKWWLCWSKVWEDTAFSMSDNWRPTSYISRKWFIVSQKVKSFREIGNIAELSAMVIANRTLSASGVQSNVNSRFSVLIRLPLLSSVWTVHLSLLFVVLFVRELNRQESAGRGYKRLVFLFSSSVGRAGWLSAAVK